ncbi:hypothetical protein OIU84_016174 [Salix udensis]|uniref:Late embryogenesis abundant protein LEA-2 subgroup domain-containing protein n=1 Tax=Salix udensis TaxID=889485 RepID=A0AAD6J8U3_9ROSI|nr:hypothetical protein OIU84_016174 [Salix udensis]
MTKRQEPSRHVITCITARVTCKLPQGFNKRQHPHPTLFLSLAFHIKSDSVLVIQCSKFDFPSLINDLFVFNFTLMNLVLKLGLLQFHDVLTEESEFNIVINGRQTNEASSPKTTRLQRPQSPGKICAETATYKEDISASFTPAKEKTVQTLLSSMLMLLSPSLHYRDSPSGNLRVNKKSDGTYLTAKMVARIEVRNPNEKIMYHFGESEVGTTVGDEEVNLGSTSLPKFTQEKGNATSLKTVTSVKSELVEDRIGSAILNQFKNKKLKVKMNVRTRVGISVAGMKTGVLGVEVLCGGVTLKETESATAVLTTAFLLSEVTILVNELTVLIKIVDLGAGSSSAESSCG